MRYVNPLGITLSNHLLYYPTPNSLSYFWNFGSLAGFCLIIQLISGLFLAMHYSADTALAFSSVEHIMRDVNYGWLLRYTHANGASVFLLVIYIHMASGLFFSSYLHPREYLWYSGVGLFLLLMATAFLGYVLPWGQMSLWGATVITNLASAIPLVGQNVAYWLWGGYSVDNATLTRFFTLHFLVPFLMVGLTLLHLTVLHVDGSTNPLGLEDSYDFIPFYPYFLIKDIFGFLCLLTVLSYLVFFEPNLLGHPDNYISANPLVTPPHIVPEWYFLPFYAILSAVPSKLGGVVAMGSSICILLLLPTLDTGNFNIISILDQVRILMGHFRQYLDWALQFVLHFSKRGKRVVVYSRHVPEPEPYIPNLLSSNLGSGCGFRSQFNFLFSFWVFNFFLLGILGGKPVEYPYSEISVVVFLLYFTFFFLFI